MGVSVLIPAYNIENTIIRAIDSALAQGASVQEVIVVDDASTDGTRTVVMEAKGRDERVVLISLPTNSGPGVARNAGIAAAQGEWMALLDGDDAYLPGRLDYLLNAAKRYDLDFVVDNIVFYDSVAEQRTRLAAERSIIGSVLHMNQYDFVRRCMTGDETAVDFGLLKPMFRVAFLRQHQLKYPDVRYGEDFEFYLQSIVAGAKFAIMPDAYYLFTERTGSISGKPSGFSRTPVSQPKLLQATVRLFQKEWVRNDSSLIDLLQARADKIEESYVSNVLSGCRKKKDYRTMASFVAQNSMAKKIFLRTVLKKVARLVLRRGDSLPSKG